MAVWVIVAVGGTVAGLVTAHTTGEVLERRRAERHPVRAVLLTDVPKRTSLVRSLGREGLGAGRLDGRRRLCQYRSHIGRRRLKTGTGVVVWQRLERRRLDEWSQEWELVGPSRRRRAG